MVIRTTSVVLASFMIGACSGGSGGGSSSSGSNGPLQVPKAHCNGSSCVTGPSFQQMSGGSASQDIAAAEEAYNYFNNTVIPAVNSVISLVERGVATAGVEECGDMENTTAPVLLTIDGQSITAKVETSDLAIPSGFTGTGSFWKRITAKLGSDNNHTFLVVDFTCGNGTNANPLVARVLAVDPRVSPAHEISAFYEKGQNSVRIELAALLNGSTRVKAKFTTTDGVDFKLSLANSSDVFHAHGDAKAHAVILKRNSGGDVCLDANSPTTNCNGLTVPTPSDLSSNLIGTGNTGWTTSTFTLASPVWENSAPGL